MYLLSVISEWIRKGLPPLGLSRIVLQAMRQFKAAKKHRSIASLNCFFRKQTIQPIFDFLQPLNTGCQKSWWLSFHCGAARQLSQHEEQW